MNTASEWDLLVGASGLGQDRKWDSRDLGLSGVVSHFCSSSLHPTIKVWNQWLLLSLQAQGPGIPLRRVTSSLRSFALVLKWFRLFGLIVKNDYVSHCDEGMGLGVPRGMLWLRRGSLPLKLIRKLSYWAISIEHWWGHRNCVLMKEPMLFLHKEVAGMDGENGKSRLIRGSSTSFGSSYFCYHRPFRSSIAVWGSRRPSVEAELSPVPCP